MTPHTLRSELDRALKDAFPSIDRLREMLLYELRWKLGEIAATTNVSTAVFEVSDYAESHGALRALFNAALKVNPDNPELRALATRWPRLLAEGDFDAAIKGLPSHATGRGPRDDIRLTLCTYNPEENVDARALLFLYAPMSERGEAWERTFGQRLTAIRGALARRDDTRDVRLTLACTPAVAMRAGFVFNRLGDFRVATAGTTRGALAGTFPIDAAGDAPRCDVAWPDEGDELHLVVSVSRDARTHHHTWLTAGGQAAGAVLSARPEGDFGDDTIRDGAHAQQWATVIRRAIARTQSEAFERGRPLQRTRVFLAGPVTLAFAVGRELNGSGAVTLMDFDRDAGAYVASFDLVT